MEQPAKLADALAGLEIALIRYRRDVRRRLGVSEDELTVLRRLSGVADVPQAELAALTTLSRSGMGALLQRLEQAGMVERRTAPGDRRLRHVCLSADGRRQMDAAYGPLEAAVAADVEDSEPLARAARAVTRSSATPAGEPVITPAIDPLWRRWG